jgi:hypothetical protein
MPARAQTTPEFSADIPAKITTPDSVDTRIGTLRFRNGAPDAATVTAVYDNLDFMRGVQAFLTGMSATSVRAVCNGLDSVGLKANQGIGLTEDLMDARSLFLTPNTTTVYGFACLDLTAGPMVLTVPPGVLGPVDDANFRWVNDVGLTGPDAGKGGSYLFVPPGYTGELPAEGYFVEHPTTNTLLFFFRAFVRDGDIKAAVDGVKAGTNIHPLHATTESGAPPAATFVNTSGLRFNTISANDFSFFEELDQVVQAEPADFVDPDTVGLYASIGIRKGQPFAPDDRMKAILTEAVAVGNATARTILFAPRDPAVFLYPDRSGSPPSWAAATSSWTAPSGSSMRAPCSSTTRPASRLRCRWPRSARARPMPGSSATRRATFSTARRPTRSPSPPRSRPGSSGPSWSTTTRPARSSRPTRSSRASTARARR